MATIQLTPPLTEALTKSASVNDTLLWPEHSVSRCLMLTLPGGCLACRHPVGNQMVTFKLDTGAELTAISQETYRIYSNGRHTSFSNHPQVDTVLDGE